MEDSRIEDSVFDELDGAKNGPSDPDFEDLNEGDDTPDQGAGDKDPKPDQADPKDEGDDEGDDLFEELDDQNDEGDYDEDGDPSPASSSLETAKYLHGLGYINIDDVNFDELEDQDIDDIIDERLGEAVDVRVEQYINALPPIVQELARYAMDGGDVSEFLSSVTSRNSMGIREDMDLNNPMDQEVIIRSGLKSQGYDDAYINAQVEFLKTQPAYMQSQSYTIYNQWKNSKYMEAQRLAEEQRYAYEQRLAAVEESRRRMYGYLDSTNEVNGVRLSRRDKRDLVSFMTDEVIQLQDGTNITPMQKVLYYDVFNNPRTAMQLAMILRNMDADGNLDLGFIDRQAQTKVAKKVKQNLRRTGNSVPSSTGRRSSGLGSLADEIS